MAPPLAPMPVRAEDGADCIFLFVLRDSRGVAREIFQIKATELVPQPALPDGTYPNGYYLYRPEEPGQTPGSYMIMPAEDVIRITVQRDTCT